MGALSECVAVTVCVQCQRRPEEGVRSSSPLDWSYRSLFVAIWVLGTRVRSSFSILRTICSFYFYGGVNVYLQKPGENGGQKRVRFPSAKPPDVGAGH